MQQVAVKRPERPLKVILAAVQAVESTANRDPEHIKV